MIRVQSSPFDPAEELSRFRGKRNDIGALSSFVGYVRGEKGGVEGLELHHYPGFTEARIAEIDADVRQRFDVTDTFIIHRYGKMQPGEPIVMVAATALHRAEAMQAVACLMDYLKTDAPFWKKETGPSGENWIEPRDADKQARQSWEQD